MILFDVAPIPTGTGLGIGIAIVFFLVLAAVAFFAFKMLKRTVTMAIRMMVVSIILLVAVIGGVALLYVSSGSSKPERPSPASRQNR